MTLHNNPLFVARDASTQQAVIIDIPLQQQRQSKCRISILKLFLCNALAILIILILAVCAGYFANNRSFSEWDGIVFMTLSIICILYIVACSCTSCIYYVCVQGSTATV
jgi:hypothetical protein